MAHRRTVVVLSRHLCVLCLLASCCCPGSFAYVYAIHLLLLYITCPLSQLLRLVQYFLFQLFLVLLHRHLLRIVHLVSDVIIVKLFVDGSSNGNLVFEVVFDVNIAILYATAV